ncbi:AEC family transporter [Hydrogenivirga sp. 128-5-R1-1]|uniref:AEC family transporter n=1 Tax=Hydrogenivirga sp. 128-5-R1-1 TaxID=392423 RepID=UPI00015F1810|nr:AEC family transporter [Hydrogenivirga sp. 128-5-R1-1]EDP75455.1 fatty acid/phospholipid synthesis protein [Hydrogenivirga sp. 128-5-R1-1]
MHERVLFVALIFLLAYALKLLRVFREEDAGAFINYVIYFSLPALVFGKVREVELTADAVGVVLSAWLVILFSLLISFIVGRLLQMEDRTLKAFVLVSSFGNTAFMGYPFTFALFGDEGLRYAVLYDQLGSFLLVVSVGFLIATGRFSLREVILFPPFVALLLALLSRPLEIPAFLSVFIDTTGKSLIPVVLFSLGLKFSPKHLLDSIKNALLTVSLKMLLVPLLVLVGLKTFGLDTLNYRVVLLESAMPPMVMAGVLAIKYGLDERLAVSAITLGILLSFFTVPLFLHLL